MRIIEILNKDSYSDLILKSIAILHCESMPHTVTSMRGIKATEGLYRRLIRTGGNIYYVIKNEKIVGVVSFTIAYQRLASLSSLVIEPFSWLQVIWKLVLFELLGRVFDSKNLLQHVNAFDMRFLYISTLFISELDRGNGIGSELLLAAKKVAFSSGIPLFVDTEIDNVRARKFYVGNNFIEVGRTKRSIIFRLRDEVAQVNQ